MSNCEDCGKPISGHQVFGEIGQSLCWECWQKRQDAVRDEMSVWLQMMNADYQKHALEGQWQID